MGSSSAFAPLLALLLRPWRLLLPVVPQLHLLVTLVGSWGEPDNYQRLSATV